MFARADVGKAPVLLSICCAALALAHAGLATFNRGIHSSPPVMTPPPGEMSRKAMALGDDQFLYRLLSIDLQNAGDGGGRVTPISQYNYDYVLGWLRAVEALDPRSQHHYILAARYFSYTQHNSDLRRVVDFIFEKAARDPRRHWFWVTQCIELADHRLNDTEYALRISQTAATYDFPDVPAWVWMFPALLLEKLGRFDEATQVLESVRTQKASRLTPQEINWMNEVSLRLKSSRG